MVISPSVGVSTPASNLAKVDFPAPLAPQTPSTLPAYPSRSTPSSALTPG